MIKLRRKLAATVGAVALILGCGDVKRNADRAQPQRAPARPLAPEVVVFSAREAGANLQSLNSCDSVVSQRVRGTWTPNTSVVESIESSLPGALDSIATYLIRSRSKPISKYYRQYVGLVEDEGPIVIVNGIEKRIPQADSAALELLASRGDTIPVEQPLWRHRIIVSCDAGVGNFIARYDPARARITSIKFRELSIGAP